VALQFMSSVLDRAGDLHIMLEIIIVTIPSIRKEKSVIPCQYCTGRCSLAEELRLYSLAGSKTRFLATIST